MIPNDLNKNYSVLKKNLEDGWSIGFALRKAGITQHIHTELLKIDTYRELILKHKKQHRTRSVFK